MVEQRPPPVSCCEGIQQMPPYVAKCKICVKTVNDMLHEAPLKFEVPELNIDRLTKNTAVTIHLY